MAAHPFVENASQEEQLNPRNSIAVFVGEQITH